MNKEEYIKKIQNISRILENAKNAEDILNSKELDIKEDFQYICLSNSTNYSAFNELITRLAQNGNKDIIEENIKIIPISAWGEIYNKNDAIKNIFINNFDTIYGNASIISFRELECFFDDAEITSHLCSHMSDVIKKFSTYDRASLVNYLNTKKNGTEIIKEHLGDFFKKGYYDISTAYAKIFAELDKNPDITKIEILRACSSELSKMLSRETAIDNETNKLLSWIYDAFEETKMDDEERLKIKEDIDKAIIGNFQDILEKSNYDKNTIKILKQFDCTRIKFANSPNYFIDKSCSEDSIQFERIENENTQNTENKAVVNNGFTPMMETSLGTEINTGDSDKVLVGLWSNMDQENKKTTKLEDEIEEVALEEIPDVAEERQKADKLYRSSKDLIDSYIKKYLGKVNSKNEDNLDAKIEQIVASNVEETNQIIKKVLSKNIENSEKEECNTEGKAEASVILNKEDAIAKNENEVAKAESKISIAESEVAKVTDDTVKIESISEVEKNVTAKNVDTAENNKVTETALVVAEQGLDVVEDKNIFIRIWEKILKIFKRYEGIDRIGE